MSKTLHEIEPFHYNHYTVKELYNDFSLKDRTKYFETLGEVRDYILKIVKGSRYSSYATNMGEITFYDLIADSEVDQDHCWKKFWGVSLPDFKRIWNPMTYTVRKGSRPFLVRNSLGCIVTADQLINAPKHMKAAYVSKWDSEAYKIREKCEQHCLSKRVLRKNNVNKIKAAVSAKEGRTYDTHELEYKESYYNYHRHVKTNQERRISCGHDNEYRNEYKFGRASRKGYHLPSSWSDISVSTWKSRKSWKTNSKRKKQWKQRDDSSL